jgi:hypothetical protein
VYWIPSPNPSRLEGNVLWVVLFFNNFQYFEFPSDFDIRISYLKNASLFYRVTHFYQKLKMRSSSRSAHKADEEKKYHSADDGHHQISDGAIGLHTEKLEEESAHEGANDTYDDVTHEAEAIAAHKFSGNPAGYQTDDEEPKDVHKV